MTGSIETQATAALTVTDSAVRRIAAIVRNDGGAGMMLRLSVAGGGCSGFRYDFTLDPNRTEDDVVFERDGVTVVVDECSLGLLAGSTLDYVEDLIGSSFQIRNPNATASCGCGSSFAV